MAFYLVVFLKISLRRTLFAELPMNSLALSCLIIPGLTQENSRIYIPSDCQMLQHHPIPGGFGSASPWILTAFTRSKQWQLLRRQESLETPTPKLKLKIPNPAALGGFGENWAESSAAEGSYIGQMITWDRPRMTGLINEENFRKSL